MSFSTSFARLMTSTANIASVSGVSTDGYLIPTYATATTHTCRITYKNELVKTFAGTEEMSRAVAWIASTGSVLNASDKITIDGSTVGPLLSAESYSDADGQHHVKAIFG